MPSSPNVTFRAAAGLDTEMLERGDSLSAIATRDLRRYYTALKRAWQESGLTRAERVYLADILSGTFLEDVALPDGLALEVEDAEPEYARIHGIDAQVLAKKLRNMPPFTRLAIVDALEMQRHLVPETVTA